MQDPQNLPADQRYTYLLNQIKQHQQIWILTDDDGCVMLNSEDEDCVPVWPNAEQAIDWATDEWAECKPMAIALEQWLERWTTGLTNDDIAIAAFPSKQEEGMVLDAHAFAQDIS